MTGPGWFPTIKTMIKRWTVSDDEIPPETTPFWIDDTVLVHYDGEEREVTVPETVTAISGDAFSDNSSVRRILIPDTVQKIGSCAFEACSKLESVRLPQSMTVLEPHLFERCHMLQTIQIPHSIREIGSKAFSSCTQLRALSIPERVEKIAADAFSNCPALILYIPAGTYAAAFARKHKLICRIIPRRKKYRKRWRNRKS